jgi:hypothetical protein
MWMYLFGSEAVFVVDEVVDEVHAAMLILLK